jgi:predicted  nucleic acid-binding Zn-ribbon protein
MSEKYVCKACGYIYSQAHYERGEGCIHCAHDSGLARRSTKQALALAREIKDRVFWHE